MAEDTADPELERLLTAHEDQAGTYMLIATDKRPARRRYEPAALACVLEARAAVTAHVARHYVRREEARDAPADPA